MAKSLDDKISELQKLAADLPADECQEHILNLCYIANDSCQEEAALLYKVAKAKYDYLEEEMGELRETSILLQLYIGEHEKGFTIEQAKEVIESEEYDLKDCRIVRVDQTGY